MANFNQAFDITMGHEGAYVHDPTDAGGETYRGVSRRFHPTWAGWRTIDGAKSRSGFPSNLSQDSLLDELVRQFYRAQFWDRFQGDAIPDQALANELFDTAVNMGVHRAVTFLQSALNLLNRNQALYADIAEDGLFGRGTLNALAEFTRKGGEYKYVVKIANILQGMHYIEYMRKSPAQEKYARGWLNRVTI